MTGYDALRERAAWRDVSGRGKIRVTGEDRARLLHAMTTNNVQALQPGQGCYAFFLSAQGRILGDVNVLCRPEHLLLDVEPELRLKLYEHLDKFIIADDAALEDLTEATATIALEGPLATQVLEQAGAPVPAAEYASLEWNERLVARLNITGSRGFFVIAPLAEREALIRQLEAAGAAAADDEAFHVVRLEHGKARYGEDISERYLVQESNQMQAVSFSKGCYLGQEIVERVRSRAQIHRRLLPLLIADSVPPQPGAKFQSGDKDVAEITSAAYSPARQQTVALAYVRIDAKPGDTLTGGGQTATVLPEPRALPPESESCR